jgi:hypothetical protein
MNTNLGNQYYNKYIKYKTKYLELKESEGGNLFSKEQSDYGGKIYTELISNIINKKLYNQYDTNLEKFEYLQDNIINITNAILDTSKVKNLSIYDIRMNVKNAKHTFQILKGTNPNNKLELTKLYNSFEKGYILNLEDEIAILKKYNKLKTLIKLYIFYLKKIIEELKKQDLND